MKTLSLTILCCCILLTSYSQFSASRIGIKLQPGLTDVHDPNEEYMFQNNLHPRFTFNLGAQYILPIKDPLIFIESGFYFVDRGTLQKDNLHEYYIPPDSFHLTSDIFIHNYYLSLPLLYRMEFNHVYFSIGPTIDYYLSTKWVWKGDENYVHKGTIPKSDFFNPLKIGAILNLGAQFQITDRIGWFAESFINVGSFNKNPYTNEYNYNLNYGLGTGINFRW